MNKVLLTGKIKRIYEAQSGTIFATIHCKDSKNSEFIDVVIFQPTFFKRYFTENAWISVVGRLHKDKRNNYKQEVIAENIYFAGDAPDWQEAEANDIPAEWKEAEANGAELPY